VIRKYKVTFGRGVRGVKNYPNAQKEKETFLYKGGVEHDSPNSPLATKMGELAPGRNGELTTVAYVSHKVCNGQHHKDFSLNRVSDVTRDYIPEGGAQ
jgi:hypothetical protein